MGTPYAKIHTSTGSRHCVTIQIKVMCTRGNRNRRRITITKILKRWLGVLRVSHCQYVVSPLEKLLGISNVCDRFLGLHFLEGLLRTFLLRVLLRTRS